MPTGESSRQMLLMYRVGKLTSCGTCIHRPPFPFAVDQLEVWWVVVILRHYFRRERVCSPPLTLIAGNNDASCSSLRIPTLNRAKPSSISHVARQRQRRTAMYIKQIIIQGFKRCVCTSPQSHGAPRIDIAAATRTRPSSSLSRQRPTSLSDAMVRARVTSSARFASFLAMPTRR